MALLWFDGFDHYGTDTARMIEGPYNQVDAAFTLSEVNPRTGVRCLRRDNTAALSVLKKEFDAGRETVGSGVACYFSALPVNSSQYILNSFGDANGDPHVRFGVLADGSVVAYLGDVSFKLAQSSSGAIQAETYHHIEVGIRADSGESASSASADISLAQYSGNSANPAQATNAMDVEISVDGLYLYVLDHSPTSAVYQFEFGTIGDLSTLSYTGNSFSVEAQIGIRNAHSILIADGGSKFYVTTASTAGSETTFQYSMGTPGDISTGAYSVMSFTCDFDTAEYQIAFIADGTNMFSL
jgi:hypothetical protein